MSAAVLGRLHFRALLAVVSLGFVVPIVRADDPDEAVKVFQSLKPSVVSIYNSEGSGTGVILNADGLILTCAHVVTSPIAYEVKIDVGGSGDDSKEVIFKKVEIVGYHPELDLALIKIDPREQNITLSPATFSKDKASPGQRIYAIGDPGAGNKVLEKTITQGIISGVDREFDKQKFYQIDAAVNPGNSGGPVVDHNGKVLGIAAFIFLQKQALNFAIPVKDVDFTKFVPLTEHKANPERSAELLKTAREYADLARQALSDQGANSEDYVRAMQYAAHCYAEALIYDPGNAEIYTAIGTQYVAMGISESAAAYLVRAVELLPWGVNNSLTYHELGLAWNRQRMDDKAITAWREGQAKFPYTASLWDDIAVYQISKKQYADAAYSASVALACGGRKSRISALQKIVRDARAQLDDSDRAELQKKTDHDAICQALDKMRLKSNKSRKNRNLYMTSEFIDLMKQVGTLDVPGVEEKISQVPLKAPENLAIGEDVADTTGDDDAAPRPKPTPPVAQVDPNGDDDAPTPPKPKSKLHDLPPDESPDVPPMPKSKKPVIPPSADDQEDVPTPHTENKPAPDSEQDTAPKNKAKPANPDQGDDWLGGAKKPDKPAEKGDAPKMVPSTIIAPSPAVTGLDLAGAVTTVDDARVVPLDVDKQEITDAVFSIDGTFLFVVQKDGLLRKLAFPSLREERQTNFASAVFGLGMTSKGLVLYVNAAQELWLVDPQTLEVRHRTPLRGALRVASAPGSGKVLVSAGPNDLELVDPVAESVSKTSASGAGADSLSFDVLAFSPDGRFVFCNQSGAICEFRLDDLQLTYVATGPKVGSDPQQIIVSPDSRYVCMPCKSGNATSEADSKTPATCVYRVSDLQKRVMTIPSGASPRELGFDATARQVYAQNNQRQLIVFSPSGEKIKEYTLAKDADPRSIKFLVHPSGRSVVVLAGGAVQWVTLP